MSEPSSTGTIHQTTEDHLDTNSPNARQRKSIARSCSLAKIVPNNASESRTSSTSKDSSTTKSASVSDSAITLPPETDSYWVHKVDGRRDSLMSLELRYRVPAVEIRRLNRLSMFSDNIHFAPYLLIPKPKKGATVVETTESRSSFIQKFRFQTGLSHPEAKYYLSGAEFDLQRALTSTVPWTAGSFTSRSTIAREAHAYTSCTIAQTLPRTFDQLAVVVFLLWGCCPDRAIGAHQIQIQIQKDQQLLRRNHWSAGHGNRINLRSYSR
jgi:hypothetical protein